LKFNKNIFNIIKYAAY